MEPYNPDELDPPQHVHTKTLALGPAPSAATKAVLLLIHGRGDDPRGIATPFRFLTEKYPDDLVFRAPAATDETWFPNPSTAALASQFEWGYFGGALDRIAREVDELLEAGVPSERIVIAGFSQGATVSQEYVMRHRRRYGGVVAMSSPLMGKDPEEVWKDPKSRPWKCESLKEGDTLAGTPVLCAIGDKDQFVPVEQVVITARVLKAAGATLLPAPAGAESRDGAVIYPGAGHWVNQHMMDVVGGLVDGLFTP